MQSASRISACLLLISLTFLLGACATSQPQTTNAVAGNPVPVLDSISPTHTSVGGSALTLTLNGYYFESSSTVMWKGVALTTSYKSATTLTAQVPASDLASAGTAMVTVVNPAPAGGTSSGSAFTIEAPSNPAPTLTSISPNSAAPGSSATTLTATGSNFIASSTVMWNGSALATSYKNSTTLTALVPATDLASAGKATVTVASPAPGGGTSSGVTFTIATPNPVPSLASISPNSAETGGPATTITATGSNFVASSAVMWDGSALTTTYKNSTTLTAQVPASYLIATGSGTITVTNPAPGGGTSSPVTFWVGTSAQAVNILANDLAWDPVNQVIYLSLPSTDGSNGNSVQVLNPTTAVLGISASAGSEPYLLSVSETSKYLYVSQLGASTVQVLTLPDLGSSGTTIQLGSSTFFGPYYAMDLQAAPNADGTVAVVLGANNVSPEEEGGVIIYDSGTARADVICGWTESGCSNPKAYLMDSIQWNSDASEMFAANYETTSFDFYTIAVSSSGFGTVTDYPGLVSVDGGGFGYHIHYDAPTGYVYDDDGAIINPSTGTSVGTFAASGLMVPDGTLGAAFFLGQTSAELGTSTYTLQSFNISTFTPAQGVNIANVVGTPTALIRWGSNGLAFTTIDNGQSPPTGAVYVVSGALVTPPSNRIAQSSENVRRTWKQPDPLRTLQSAETGEHSQGRE